MNKLTLSVAVLLLAIGNCVQADSTDAGTPATTAGVIEDAGSGTATADVIPAPIEEPRMVCQRETVYGTRVTRKRCYVPNPRYDNNAAGLTNAHAEELRRQREETARNYRTYQDRANGPTQEDIMNSAQQPPPVPSPLQTR